MLRFNLQLTIFDKNGRVLLNKKAAEEIDIEGSISGPHTMAKMMVPEAFKRVLETILNDYQVAEALQ